MDLVLFCVHTVLMGILASLIVFLFLLRSQARRGELVNDPLAEKLVRDFRNVILPLVLALVLTAVAFYISVFLPLPPSPCSVSPSTCNYLMSI